jgi:hypothetical protein
MEPLSVRSGDSVSWTRDEATYTPAAGWTLNYRLIPASGAAIDVATTGAGSTFTVSLAAATTAAWAAGSYTLAGMASKGAERVTVFTGTLSVLPNLATAAAFDPRTAAEIELAAARTAWAQGRKSYTIGDRQVTYADPADMLVRIRYLEQQVANERYLAEIGAGREASPPGRVLYRAG